MMINAIIIVLLGILAVFSFLPFRKKEKSIILSKIIQYQGWIGLVCAVIGLCAIVFNLLSFNKIDGNLLIWIVNLVILVAQVTLGFTLGYEIHNKLDYSETVGIAYQVRSGEEQMPFKETMGFIAIGLGLCQIVLLILI